MIYCLNCGKGIPDQSKFCTFCGTPTAQVDPQNPNVAASSTTSQPVTPVEQQTVTPVPPPPPPQFRSSTPPQPQQFVNPNFQAGQQQQYVTPTPVQQFVRTQPVTTKNEFYKNVGFWGALLTFIGFFLPYVNGYDFSFYYLVSDLAADKPELYLYLIFPVSGAVLLLQGLTGILPRFIVVIFKMLPILMLALFALGISNNSSSFGFMGNDVGSVLKNIGVGLYMIVIGSILMLFFHTTKKKV